MIDINKLIAEAIKTKTNPDLYRAIKTEFLKYEKSPGSPTLDDNAQVSIINKMIKQRQDSIDIYIKANRNELANKEQEELNLLKELLPAEASEDDIRIAVENWISGKESFTKKDMGMCIKDIKSMFINIDGKKLATIVQSYL